MSILIGSLIGLILAFFPLVMTIYYKTSSGIVICNLILCLLGFFTFGVCTFIAFIIGCIAIGLANTFKSILFALFLIVLSWVLIGAEIAAWMAVLS